MLPFQDPHKKSVAFVVDFDSSPTSTPPSASIMAEGASKKKTVPQLATKILKPDPADELDRVALTGIEDVSKYLILLIIIIFYFLVTVI